MCLLPSAQEDGLLTEANAEYEIKQGRAIVDSLLSLMDNTTCYAKTFLLLLVIIPDINYLSRSKSSRGQRGKHQDAGDHGQ